jgi:hypothetical protein
MMLKLNNGHPVIAAHVVRGKGAILAESNTDYIVWDAHWNPDAEEWDCSNGHYFQKSMNPESGDAWKMAKYMFDTVSARYTEILPGIEVP